MRGLCEDKSNLEIMDAVGVYGDITDSVLAYNYYGHYSFGHEGGNIIDNEVKPTVPFACFCRRARTDPFMMIFVFCVGSVFLVGYTQQFHYQKKIPGRTVNFFFFRGNGCDVQVNAVAFSPALSRVLIGGVQQGVK